MITFFVWDQSAILLWCFTIALFSTAPSPTVDISLVVGDICGPWWGGQIMHPSGPLRPVQYVLCTFSTSTVPTAVHYRKPYIYWYVLADMFFSHLGQATRVSKLQLHQLVEWVKIRRNISGYRWRVVSLQNSLLLQWSLIKHTDLLCSEDNCFFLDLSPKTPAATGMGVLQLWRNEVRRTTHRPLPKGGCLPRHRGITFIPPPPQSVLLLEMCSAPGDLSHGPVITWLCRLLTVGGLHRQATTTWSHATHMVCSKCSMFDQRYNLYKTK